MRRYDHATAVTAVDSTKYYLYGVVHIIRVKYLPATFNIYEHDHMIFTLVYVPDILQAVYNKIRIIRFGGFWRQPEREVMRFGVRVEGVV